MVAATIAATVAATAALIGCCEMTLVDIMHIHVNDFYGCNWLVAENTRPKNHGSKTPIAGNAALEKGLYLNISLGLIKK